ncbi:melanoma-associated antigen B10-like [Ochotona curzoniae]|uniref:melanoma-associated antigen B10-like n=1 Tax=Ochotona curzoniae TaxID=130825 RepID=UPI001B3498F1|nr:melanoma-associated antigen B10-like [Ochotona curzoniae]
MPRGQKSKLRSREKRRHMQSEIQSVQDAPATAAAMAEEGEPFSSSPPRSSAKSQDGKRASASQARIATGNSCVNPLDQKALLLVQSMLRKYSMRELITKEGMLRYVTRKYKMHFHEIFQKASDFMGLVFGIFVKEIDPIRHHYALVSQLSQIGEPEVNSDDIMLHSGLLMIILCVIFLKGNEAPEEDIWEVLNVIGIFAGKSHFILGEPKQLITQDLVQEMYLEYKQVPNSDPPRYGFLWGLRAHTEISKTRAFEVFSKIHNTVPTAFPAWCESALGDEEERTRARFTDMLPISVQCGVDFNSFSDSRI